MKDMVALQGRFTLVDVGEGEAMFRCFDDIRTVRVRGLDLETVRALGAQLYTAFDLVIRPVAELRDQDEVTGVPTEGT